MTQQLLNDLAKAKAEFQLRAIMAAMGVDSKADGIEWRNGNEEANKGSRKNDKA